MDSTDLSGPSHAFSLLETMRLEMGRIPRLDRHLTRAAGAAARLGFPWRADQVREAIDSASEAHPSGLWRLRLLLAPDGCPTVQCTPHSIDSRRWRVAFALDPVDPTDPLILYKTTARHVYDRAKRTRSDVDDVLLWNDRGEVTESTIGNLVAEIDGIRYTPPVSSGLLAGTFRAEQLDEGTIVERVLSKGDVIGATRLWIINSLREWVEVEMVE